MKCWAARSTSCRRRRGGLLLAVDEMVTAECERQKMERSDYRFSRRDVREATGWGDTQLKIHLHRLEELEYLLVHRGGRGQSFVYELVFARRGDSGRPMLAGLIDMEKLSKTWLRRKEVGAGGASRRGQVGPKSAGCRGWLKPSLRQYPCGFQTIPSSRPRKALIRARSETATPS